MLYEFNFGSYGIHSLHIVILYDMIIYDLHVFFLKIKLDKI